MAHRPIGEDQFLPVMAFADRVEFVGGPREGHSEDRNDMPESIKVGKGLYRRSVRCAEDGAMRYVWAETSRPDGRK